MLTVAIGHSDDPDAYAAAKDIIEQCQTSLQGRSPQVGILFAAVDFEYAIILETLNTAFPDMVIVGCTTDGELSSELAFQQDSLVLMAIASDTLAIGAGVGYKLSEDPEAAVQQAIARARDSLSIAPDAVPSLCLAFPESLTYDSPLLVAHLQQALGDSVPLFGGFAGDQSQFKKTYQFYGSEVLTDAIPILLFYGELKLGHGVAHGWVPTGAKGTITRTDGTILQEIDHQPALEFYQRYLNDLLPSPNSRSPFGKTELTVTICEPPLALTQKQAVFMPFLSGPKMLRCKLPEPAGTKFSMEHGIPCKPP